MIYSILADVVVAFHLAYVSFVVVGLALILTGAAFGWGWVRNVWFRAAHLLSIAAVAVESLVDFTCPLTSLENWLREMGGETKPADISFIGRLLKETLFFDVPDTHWGFKVAYVGFALLVLLTFVLVPPRFRRGKKEMSPPESEHAGRAFGNARELQPVGSLEGLTEAPTGRPG